LRSTRRHTSVRQSPRSYTSGLVAKQRAVVHADLRHIGRDEARQDQRGARGQARYERAREFEKDGAQNVGHREIERTAGALKRARMANPIVDTIGACIALSVRTRKRIDLNGIHDGSEPGRADGQDPRPATEVEHAPGPGARGECGYRLKTELGRFVRAVPEPSSRVDDEPDLIVIVRSQHPDDSPARGDDDADAV
jgi:hypothetical protein